MTTLVATIFGLIGILWLGAVVVGFTCGVIAVLQFAYQAIARLVTQRKWFS